MRLDENKGNNKKHTKLIIVIALLLLGYIGYLINEGRINEINAKKGDSELNIAFNNSKEEDSYANKEVIEEDSYAKESEIVGLIVDYEQAYFDALELLNNKKFYSLGDFNDKNKRFMGQVIESPYNEEGNLNLIKQEVRSKFNGILSDEAYKRVEREIFTLGLYMDIRTIKYSFSYVYADENGKNNLDIKGNEVTIKEPRFLRTARYSNSSIGKDYLVYGYHKTKIFVLNRDIDGKLYIDNHIAYNDKPN